MRNPTGVALLLDEVPEEPRGPREERDRLRGRDREAEVEQDCGDRHRDVHRERLAPCLRHRVAQLARQQDVRAADATGVGELENALGPRIERSVDRVAEARRPLAGLVDRGSGFARRLPPASSPASTPRLRLDQELRAQLGGAEDDRPAAEDPGGDGALKRPGIGGERHPGRDVRGHHPVLGDGDQEQVEEVALLVGRLLAGQQEMEVLGEA